LDQTARTQPHRTARPRPVGPGGTIEGPAELDQHAGAPPSQVAGPGRGCAPTLGEGPDARAAELLSPSARARDQGSRKARTWATSSSGSSGCSTTARPLPTPSTITSTAPITAVPTAEARFWVVPRSEPTSPARCFGAEVTSTLNTSVTSAPCPIPKTMRPRIVGRVSQLFVTTNASQISATVVSRKEN